MRAIWRRVRSRVHGTVGNGRSLLARDAIKGSSSYLTRRDRLGTRPTPLTAGSLDHRTRFSVRCRGMDEPAGRSRTVRVHGVQIRILYPFTVDFENYCQATGQDGDPAGPGGLVRRSDGLKVDSEPAQRIFPNSRHIIGRRTTPPLKAPSLSLRGLFKRWKAGLLPWSPAFFSSLPSLLPLGKPPSPPRFRK